MNIHVSPTIKPKRKRAAILAVTTVAVALVGIMGTAFGQKLTFIQNSLNPNQARIQSKSSDNLGPRIQEINRLATQMAWQVGWEVSQKTDDSEKKGLADLHKQLRKHSALTAKLLKTYQGDSAKDFQKTIDEVRKSLKKIDELAKKANLSPTMAKLHKQCAPTTKFVYDNRSSFKPE